MADTRKVHYQKKGGALAHKVLNRWGPCVGLKITTKIIGVTCRRCLVAADEKKMMAPERFMSRVEKRPGGCWIWTSYINARGYGETFSERRRIVAHRLSHLLFRGPIPYGLVLDHLCRNRACVNPDHLEAVTLRENIRRGIGAAAINARKKVCIRGHNNWNIRKKEDGRIHRSCIACKPIYRRMG